MSETTRVWSPLTKVFQTLDFQFLNNVDPKFAQSIRDDGRLESFRSLLRKIGNGAGTIADFSTLDSYVRDCKDELVGEYAKAQADWSKIDESFIKWAGCGSSVAAAAGIVTGHLIPDVAALSAATLSAVSELGLRYLRQQQFRRTNPMSVFIDLARKGSPGKTLY